MSNTDKSKGQTIYEKQVPNSIEAEESLLGSILIDPTVLDLVRPLLETKDFYREAHRLIYETILHLADRRVEADIVTLVDELTRREQLELVGGYGTILPLLNTVPTSRNAEHYARIIIQKSRARQLLQVAIQMTALAMEHPDDMLEQAEQALYALREEKRDGRGFSPLKEIIELYGEELDRLQSKHTRITGIPTGFIDLDSLLGGAQRKDLLILAGRPGMGKTSMALSIILNAIQRNYKVAFFSLEMSEQHLARRLTGMDSKLDIQFLRSGWIADDQWEQVFGTISQLSGLPLWINESAHMTVASLRSQLRRLSADCGSLDMVVVDFLQLLAPADNGKKYDNDTRAYKVGEICRGLKALAKEFNVPVLALSQLSRAVELRSEKMPTLSDLKESGGIEENADVVMALHRSAYYEAMEKREGGREKQANPVHPCELNIIKHRNGPTGEISLIFNSPQTRFYSSDNDAL